MPKKTFLQLYIIPKEGVSRENIEATLNKGLDWIRYAPNNYVLFTSVTIKAWMGRLREHVEDGGTLFICKLDVTNRNGLMINEFWEWLQKNEARIE
ncbi:hypothetical protein ECE50_021010 [Chitinophaga sp. Mgbs1]|uniref:Uncharacterized protein n=1 Tax=Chitinophaga solisilvae TaxID=1233460 RepID=A0A433W9C9_9BACT|nr:hypothetical protein [Chitinophaga solisilvae]